MAKQTFSKNQIIIAVVGAIVIFTGGFFAGDAYRTNKIENAFKDVLSGLGSNSSELSKEKKILDKKLGEEVDITTMKLKVNKSEEKNTISSEYGAKSAKDGTKFVVVELNAVNASDTMFRFDPDDKLQLIDNQNRKYQTYDDSFLYIENSLNSEELSPGIAKTGVVVYEIPNDSNSYGILIDKDGSNERFRVGIK